MKKDDSSSNEKSSNWIEEEIALLVKAANLFPAGTNRRWFQVCQYINDHNRERLPKTEKEVIKQAKLRAAQVTAGVLAEKQQKLALPKVLTSATTTNGAGRPGTTIDDWTLDEQMKFEKALKEIPTADPQRWERIAEATGKTKKECVQRYKKIVEMLKAKKSTI